MNSSRCTLDAGIHVRDCRPVSTRRCDQLLLPPACLHNQLTECGVVGLPQKVILHAPLRSSLLGESIHLNLRRNLSTASSPNRAQRRRRAVKRENTSVSSREPPRVVAVCKEPVDMESNLDDERTSKCGIAKPAMFRLGSLLTRPEPALIEATDQRLTEFYLILIRFVAWHCRVDELLPNSRSAAKG